MVAELILFNEMQTDEVCLTLSKIYRSSLPQNSLLSKTMSCNSSRCLNHERMY